MGNMRELAHRPLACLVLAFAGGIVLGEWAGSVALWCLLTAMAGMALLWLARRNSQVGQLALLCLAAVAGAALLLAQQVPAAQNVGALSEGGQTLVGTVNSAPSHRDGVWRFVLTAEAHEDDAGAQPVTGRTYVRLRSAQSIARGERWRLTGRLRPVRTTANPGSRSEADRLSSLDVSSVLTVGSEALAQRLGEGDLGPLARYAFAAQRRALAALTRNVGEPYRDDTAAVAGSVVFGVHAAPPPAEISNAFRRAGTIHLLVVSGAMVSMVFGMVFLPSTLGAGWRRRWRERQADWPINYRGRVRFRPGLLAAAIAMLTVIYYSILTEGGQAVIRAAAMGVLVALALALRRTRVAREHGLNVDRFTLLAAAALLILAASPKALFQPGFQLSFAAVAAIMYLVPNATRLFTWLPRWVGYMVVATLAAQFATFPILVWHFGQAPIAGFGANLLAIPLASVVLVGGMTTCVLTAIAPWAAPVAGSLTGLSTRWLVWISGAFAALPWASVDVARPSIVFVAIWYLGLLAAGMALGRRAQPRPPSSPPLAPQGVASKEKP